MGYNLMYIDDDIEKASILKDGLMTNGLLSINVIKAENFETQLKEIIDIQKNIDGIILDLRLDENQKGNRKALYTAPALAQQLRSKISNTVFSLEREFPIFLLTSKAKLSQFYESDTSSHDLFDDSFIKDTNFGANSKEYEKVMYSIIEAYKSISQKDSYETLLDKQINSDTINRIFRNPFSESTISEKAIFIHKQIIKQRGILVDEILVAARLGIDIEQSDDDDWNNIKKTISKSKYTGVYSDYYELWWMSSIVEWWKTEITKKPIASLDAESRVDLLKKKLSLTNIVAATKLPKSASSRFWTICKKLLKPLDPIEGFKLKQVSKESWQEVDYFSLEAFFMGLVKPEEIDPNEIERFKDVKDKF